MNRGMIAKSVQETWLVTLLFSLGIGFVEGLIAHILPTVAGQMAEVWASMPFIQDFLQALLGTELAGVIGPDAITAIAWTHPVVLILVATHAILFCSRMPAGEVETGTADVLLGLPVSRMSIYTGEAFVCVSAGAMMVGFALIGNCIGGWSVRSEIAFSLWPRVVAAMNLLCLYLAIGGVAWLMSSLGSRRGRVCGAVYAIFVSSLLVNFLAPFNAVVEKVSVLGLLNYYRPHTVVQTESWPIGDMVVLVAVGVLTWLAGAYVFTRRDVSTI